jgi:hypothetical protein
MAATAIGSASILLKVVLINARELLKVGESVLPNSKPRSRLGKPFPKSGLTPGQPREIV